MIATVRNVRTGHRPRGQQPPRGRRIHPHVAREAPPDLQYHFAGGADGQPPRANPRIPGARFTMRPASRGTCNWAALIRGGACRGPGERSEESIADLRQAVRLTNEIFAQPALQPLGPLSPAAGVANSDDELDDRVRAHTEVLITRRAHAKWAPPPTPSQWSMRRGVREAHAVCVS